MIPLNESNRLEFSMSIKNTQDKVDRANLIIEGENFDISLPILLENDKAIVNIPVLENVIPAGKIHMRMEIVLGGVLYSPFKDVLEFFAPPSIIIANENKSTTVKVVDKAPIIFVTSTSAPSEVVEKVVTLTPAQKRSQEFADLMVAAWKSKNLQENQNG
jgi:hypothetical protein